MHYQQMRRRRRLAIRDEQDCTGLEEVQDGLSRIRAAIDKATAFAPGTIDT